MKIEILYDSRGSVENSDLASLSARLSEKGAVVSLYDLRTDSLFSGPENDCPDLFLVLGGDGTIIRAAHRASYHDIPLLGINFGTLGCLAELDRNEIDRLDELFSGSFVYDRRTMLRAVLTRNGETVGKPMDALNDIVIRHGDGDKIIQNQLCCDDAPVAHYRSDGTILSTPTGSTGYAISAGGPMVSPCAPVICVTPICAHSLGMKPIIFSDASRITLCSQCRSGCLVLNVDGYEDVPMESGDTLSVTRSDRSVRFLHLSNHPDHGSFYRRAIRKLTD